MNKDVYIITCSKCDKENRYEDYSCVGPDQRESIIDDSIMTYTCPHCGEKTFLKHPLTYIDPVHHFIVQYGQDKEQFFHGVEQIRTTPLYKDYIFRYTDSWLSFKEKIMILENDRDDRLMELYKLALKNELDEEVPSLFLFDIKEDDPLMKKILKYDTSLMVDNTWAKRLYDYRIIVSLCEVQTKLQVRTYLIPSYDHVDVGDYVYVYENGERVLGQVMTKNFKNIADVPDHLHFIEKALPIETEYDKYIKHEYENLLPLRDQRLESFLDVLNDLRFYYYIEEIYENASNYTMDIDGLHLIPLYTDQQEAMDKKPENGYVLVDLLTDILKMTFEKIDGYIINENSLFILDSHFIDMFLSFARQKKTEIN